MTLAELGGVTSLMLGYTKWTEDQEYRSGEEQKRIPSIIQSHSSNDRQIERPQIIFEMNKLLKDEEVPPLCSQTTLHFQGLISWRELPICNNQQRSKAPQQRARHTVLITTKKLN